ncbi:MAG: GTP cyclohydrolase I FolE [Lachnospiraceae bacterium]|nr:GTP cyclohydrolase I FolE [Lachnospiraceae bacterium]
MIDEEKIKQAIKMILEGIGEDPEREGLAGTPDRVARMYGEIFAGMDDDPANYLSRTFSAEGTDMVVEREIPFYSMCEHHLMPFFGHAYIGYIPKDRVVGLSKLARAVDVYAKRPQIQEQMTAQIADAIYEDLDCAGVIVVLKAEHMCMSMRGVKKGGTLTVTEARRGVFESDHGLEERFFRMIGIR